MAPVDTDERDALAAAAGGAAKRAYVRRIFSEIAPRYDLLNHLLSANIDESWRRRAIGALGWERAPVGTYLDICSGTMDIAALLAAQRGFFGQVICADFAEPMLRAGAFKIRGSALRPVVADALRLPLPDGISAGAIVAFGLRNFEDLDAGLGELRRVLAPGRRLVVLEFTTPPNPLVRVLYRTYSRHLLPIVGRVVSGHRSAYRYLPASVAAFPDAPNLAMRMEQAGFTAVRWELLTSGIAAVHWGERAA